MAIARSFFHCLLLVMVALAPALGAELSREQRNWHSRLYLAIRAGDLAAVNEALAHGADVDPPAGDHHAISALMWAAGDGHIDIMKRLMEAGADVNFRSDTGDSA